MLWAREAAEGFSIFSQSSAGAVGETGSGEEGLVFSCGAWEVEDLGSGGSSEGEGGNIFLDYFQHIFPEVGAKDEGLTKYNLR